MTHSTDDYGLDHGNSQSTRETEPADPPQAVCTERDDLRLAPSSVKVDRLPDPLTDGEQPLTVSKARETYLKVQRDSWNTEGRTSKYERHKLQTYPRILEADRYFRTEYEDLTTAMLTRRLSPIDDAGEWLTPWECNEMLHGGSIQRSVREAAQYQLGGFEYEWVAVTAPTESAGTPHEHIYFWIDDPDDKVTTDHFSTALDKHLKYCVNAYQENHRYQTDGTGGSITVRHTPEIVTEIPNRLNAIKRETDTSLIPNTRGAQYLASQLAHLPLGDYYDGSRENPPDALFEGAALAWASHRNWFRASAGVPAL